MSRRIRSLHLAVALLVCSLAFASQTHAQSYARDRASGLINQHAKTIASFMHPTANFNSMYLRDSQTYGSGGLRLTYRFQFTSAFGNPFWSEMIFVFHANGSLDYVSTGSTTGLVLPLGAAGIAVDAVRQAARDNPDLRNNETLVRILDRGDARSLLEWILKNVP